MVEKIKILRVEIPGLPTSVNHTYGRRRGGKGFFKVKASTDWERVAYELVKKKQRDIWSAVALDIYKGLPIKLTIDVCRPSWRGKSKAKREHYVRPDLDNFIKLTIDAVFKALGLDDSAVVDLTARKVESQFIGVIVELEFI